ncbi:MAG TPA: HD domain-containing protein [Candidatus Limnocylindria bacterium]|nr:HD domain-containing protein [Candidatus Limnocylindria bacterium]
MRKLIRQNILWVILSFINVAYPRVEVIDQKDKLHLHLEYGDTCISEPVLVELIKSPAFERLKHIHQYGITHHAQVKGDFSRYDHSLGVFFLTRNYGAPLSEQVAALLHDVSHTVFSHVGDHIYNCRLKKSSYQDEIHDWYLEKSGIASILQRYGVGNCCTQQAKKCQRCFEQDLPDLCADRIEYNLRGGLVDGLITQEEVGRLLQSLRFHDGVWFFDDVEHAKKFGLVSLQLSESRWGAAWNVFVDACACQAIKRALALGLITTHDVHFSTDDVVWHILATSTDTALAEQMWRIAHWQDCYCVCPPEESDLHLKGKFSGTNPWVQTAQGLMRLTELDSDYAAEFERIKELVTKGFFVKLRPTCHESHTVQ